MESKSRSLCTICSFACLSFSLAFIQSFTTLFAAPLYEMVKSGASLQEIQGELSVNQESVNLTDSEGETAIFHAVRRADIELTRTLLHAGSSPDQVNNRGASLLQIADDFAREVPPEEFQRLRKSYVDGGLSPEDAERLLIRSNAAYRDYKSGEEKREVRKEIRDLLLVELKRHRETVESDDLFIAVREDRIDAVKDLLCSPKRSGRVGINSRGRDGQTPLIIALLNFNMEMCEIILEKGADISIRDDSGKSATDYLLKMNDLFDKHRIEHDLEQLRNAIDSGSIIPSRTDKDGVTILMKAAAKNDYEACRLLLEYGAKVDATDSNGDTAYDYIGRDTGNPYVKKRLAELLQVGAK